MKQADGNHFPDGREFRPGSFTPITNDMGRPGELEHFNARAC